MIFRVLWRPTLVAGIVFMCLLVPNRLLFQEDLSQITHLSAKRLGQTVCTLLQKAHEIRDDLAIQEIVQIMARAPGVSFACVLNNKDIAVAHSRLSQLGKPYRVANVRDLWRFALLDQDAEWGKLVFIMSSAPERQLKRHHEWWCLGIGVLSWFILVVMEWRTGKRQDHLKAQLLERDTLLFDEKKKFENLEHRLSQYQKDSATWLQSAVDRIQHSCMVLDQRQRVIAANVEAAKLFGTIPAYLVGMSWYDLPLLESRSRLECINPPPNQ